MRVIDVTFPSPSRNLAIQEVLLDGVESGRGPETLRFWEAQSLFAVLGVSQALREHVNESACREDGVGIFRRASAGGCVLQGPGCLNYTVVLSHELHPESRTVRGAYCYVFEKVIAAFQKHGISLRHKGVSDLAINGKKVSGNAQKRRRKSFLLHGTLLYDFNSELMERYLKEPTERPVYRGDRTHRGFVRNIPMTSKQLRLVMCEAFGVEYKPARLTTKEMRAARDLDAEKYKSPGWIRRR